MTTPVDAEAKDGLTMEGLLSTIEALHRQDEMRVRELARYGC